MGNYCCHSELPKYECCTTCTKQTSNFHYSRGIITKPIGNRHPTLQDENGVIRILDGQDEEPPQNHLYQSFETHILKDISHLSFSNRRYRGYRTQFEFDKKRILASSTKEVQIIGYDHQELPYTVASYTAVSGTKITFAKFMQDINPSYVLIIEENKSSGESILRLFRLQKRKEHFQLSSKDNEDLKEDIDEFINEEGGIQKFRTRDNQFWGDNVEVQMDEDYVKRKRSEKHKFGQYYMDETIHSILNNTNNSLMNVSFHQIVGSYDNIPIGQINFNNTLEFLGEDDDEDDSSSQGPFQDVPILTNAYEFQLINYQILGIKSYYIKNFYYSSIYSDIIYTIDNENQIQYHLLVALYEQKQLTLEDLKRMPRIVATYDFTHKLSKPVSLKENPFEENRKTEVQSLAFYGNLVYIIYKGQAILDVVRQDEMRVIKCIDVGKCVKKGSHGSVVIEEVQFVLVPRSVWNDRELDYVYQARDDIIYRLVICGKCTVKDQLTSEPGHNFIALLNPRNETISHLRIIYPNSTDITCVGYGPFDNGHILIALSDGGLEIFNPSDLASISNMSLPQIEFTQTPQGNNISLTASRVQSEYNSGSSPIKGSSLAGFQQRFNNFKRVTNQYITQLEIEPGNTIIAGTNHGRIYSLSLIKKEMDYIYMDTGRKYLTIAINRKRVVEKQERRNKLSIRRSSSCASMERMNRSLVSSQSGGGGQDQSHTTNLCCL